MNFSDFRDKDVINIPDGRKLGRPIDLIFSENACIEALVVPEPCGFFGYLQRDRGGLAIPWSRIRRIGSDVILVEIEPRCNK